VCLTWGLAPSRTSLASRRGGEGSTHLRLWFGFPVAFGRRRRHRGEATQGEEEDGKLYLILKHPNATLCNIRLKIDDTLETCFEIFPKTPEKTLETIVKHIQHLDKILATCV
jgi:hypothetical protein